MSAPTDPCGASSRRTGRAPPRGPAPSPQPEIRRAHRRSRRPRRPSPPGDPAGRRRRRGRRVGGRRLADDLPIADRRRRRGGADRRGGLVLRRLAAGRPTPPASARRIPVGGVAFSATLAACPAPYAYPRPIDVGGVGLRVVGPGFGTVDIPARRVSPQANDWRAEVDLLVVKEYLRRVDQVQSDLEFSMNLLCPLLTVSSCAALPPKYRLGCGHAYDPGAAICAGFSELSRRVS
ncbi:hypothetical protein [Oharaeibacter diazotrophicus]|uniref:hypothetical protein n=1 Tax=Oharaeibacter diazotrophicus TaxID=1920512 RepID=UPI001A99096A|nr:hypothetical protein [Oharaeibacter diazotrophicus]